MLLSPFPVGSKVCACESIVEDDFNGRRYWVHAAKGDHGVVVGPGVDRDWVNVRWDHTRTVTVCHCSEVKSLSARAVA